MTQLQIIDEEPLDVGTLMEVLGVPCMCALTLVIMYLLTFLFPQTGFKNKFCCLIRDHVAWSLTAFAILLEIVLLCCVWGTWANAPRSTWHDYARPVGWLGSFAAAIIFGFSEVPIKVPQSQDIGPALFNAFCFLGNGLGHCIIAAVLLLYDRSPHLHWQGGVAALDLMLVQTFARSAIWILGIAVAPPLWCAVGMASSFAWGTVAFGDQPQSMPLCLLGLSLLIVGVGLVSLSSVLSKPEEHSVADAESNITPSSAASGIWGLAQGVAYGLAAGVADGSMVAFFQQLEATSPDRMASSHGAAAALGGYFASFGLVALTASCTLLIIAAISKTLPKPLTMQHVLPGVTSGLLWAGASSCSALASHCLGMALSFPLTQTAAVITGLLGICVFGEVRGGSARLVFALALVTMAVGTILLSSFGRPIPDIHS